MKKYNLLIPILFFSLAIIPKNLTPIYEGLINRKPNDYYDKISFSLAKQGPNKLLEYGKLDAPVNLKVFLDFECPYCAEAYRFLEDIRATYPDKVQITIKNFPLSFHQNAKAASRAVLAAAKQNVSWQYMKQLFLNQESLSIKNLIDYATYLGMDMEQFIHDFRDSTLELAIERDLQFAQELKVQGTPAFYINNRSVSGPLSLDNIKYQISQEANLLKFDSYSVSRDNDEVIQDMRLSNNCPELRESLEMERPFEKNALAECTREFYNEVREVATEEKPAVFVNCHLNLQPTDVITKKIILQGNPATGVMINCNNALLEGGIGSFNEGRDMIEVRSKEVDPDKWERPECIEIRSCRINGSLRIFGMGKNGEAEKIKVSSHQPGHVARVRENAPRHILLDSLTVTGVGRNPIYFAPGVSFSSLMNSEIKGISKQVGVYLDAESILNTLSNNYIHVQTSEGELLRRPLVALDGSSFNRIINNRFSNLDEGGIYLYRNCGEGGTIRYSPPSHNQIINNVFYYNKYKGDHPAIFIGSRTQKSARNIPIVGKCAEDKEFGRNIAGNHSARDDRDFARYNVVMQNQIYKRSVDEMIRVGEVSTLSPRKKLLRNILLPLEVSTIVKSVKTSPDALINSPNYINYNETVESEISRKAGCYVVNGYERDFILDQESVDLFEGRDGMPICRGYHYQCNNSQLHWRYGSDCSVEKIPFECKIKGNNQGCQKVTSCPPGKKIVGAVAACNLEHGSISQQDVDRIPPNHIRVYRKSDKVSDGQCFVEQTNIKVDQEAIHLSELSNTSVIGCREKDKNGGDCHIKGLLYCY